MDENDHDNNKLVPIIPSGLLDRVAEDPNAGAIVALGLAGLNTLEKNLEADRQERQREREAEREEKRLAAEERRFAAEREEREKAAQRVHQLALWRQKERFLVVLGPLCCFAIVLVGVFLIFNEQAVLGATIAGAAGAALVGMAKDLTRGIGASSAGGDTEREELPPAKPNE